MDKDLEGASFAAPASPTSKELSMGCVASMFSSHGGKRAVNGRSNYHLGIALLLLVWVVSGCRSDNRNAAEVLRAFLDEFYTGRAQPNLARVLDEYTDWPDFVSGDSVQIATDQDIQLVTENGEEATFEVRFRVIGEESLGKFEAGEVEAIQTYRLRRRRGAWKILQPINIPCISVVGELTRLRTAVENASNRIAASDFTETATREHFESLISNAQASIALLDRYR